MRLAAIVLTNLLALRALAGGADGWRQLPPATAEWKDAVPVSGTGRTVLTLDQLAVCRLMGAPLAKPLPATTAETLTRFNGEKTAVLSITFPSSGGAGDFTRFVRDGDGQAKSVWKSGAAALTRMVLIDRPSGAVFIHLQADHPGALTFRTTLGSGAARIEDRQQLVSAADGGLAVHVWVLPFESDVEPDHGSILVRGEGEAMVIWAFGKTGEEKELAGVFARLAARYDPGAEHPDFSKIWRGVLADRARTADSP